MTTSEQELILKLVEEKLKVMKNDIIKEVVDKVKHDLTDRECDYMRDEFGRYNILQRMS